MDRYDFYTNLDGVGYLLVVQSHRINVRKTKVVVPLLPNNKFPMPTDVLHPVFTIAGQDHIMATHLLAAVQTSELAHHMGSLAHAHSEIMNALDMLLTGI